MAAITLWVTVSKWVSKKDAPPERYYAHAIIQRVRVKGSSWSWSLVVVAIN